MNPLLPFCAGAALVLALQIALVLVVLLSSVADEPALQDGSE